ncbi:MAG: glutamine synthetase type III, partial [Clostridia bacterium]|nr:glutamine synthetase type III [Clostridia bacterium]
HWKILFNGNGYGAEWIVEAEKRGLKNYRTTPDAMEHYLDEKNIKLLGGLGIYTEDEMRSHYEIKLEKYCQTLNIEVETMIKMVNKDILCSSFKYMNVLADTAFKFQKAVSINFSGNDLLSNLNKLIKNLIKATENLEKLHAKTREMKDLLEKSKSYAYQILPAMEEVRAVADQIEVLLGEEYKPFPSYEDLLYSVQ